jgi:uncharacterized membrane protein YgcG
MNTKISLLYLIVLIILFSCQKKEESKIDEDKLQEITKERVFDGVGVLSDLEKKKLTSLIFELEKNVGSQIAILIIDTLNGETIEEFSLKSLEKMKLGRSQFNDGLLIIQSVKDRKLRIEVGLGLEKIIRDELAARIVRETVVPRFKEGKYYDGFYGAVTEIKNLIEKNKDLVGQAP